MKALVLGGSGQTGQALLEQLSRDQRFTSITAISRREFTVPARCHLLKLDFDNIENWKLPEIPTHVFCSLGTTIKQAGSKENFQRIDKDLVIKLATFFKTLGTGSFCYVSSMGASTESAGFYLKMKGQTEKELTELGFDSLIILRPGLLLTKKRDESRPLETFGQGLMRLLNPVIPESLAALKGVDTELLALRMIEHSVNGKSKVIESAEIQKKLL